MGIALLVKRNSAAVSCCCPFHALAAKINLGDYPAIVVISRLSND